MTIMQISELKSKIESLLRDEYLTDSELAIIQENPDLSLSSLSEDLDFDSLDFIEMIMIIERNLKIRFDDNKFHSGSSYNDLINEAYRLLAEKK